MNNNANQFQVNNVNAAAPNNGKGVITYCSRCGGEMYSNSRYCMKCGNLNPDHPDNKGVAKYIEKKGEGYTVGSGQSLIKKENTILNKKATLTAVGDNTGNFTLCFAVNMVLYMVITCGSCFYYYLLGRGDFISIISSNLGEIMLQFSVVFFYIYSLELVFMKMNKPWWQAIIPFYNFYVLAEAVIGNGAIPKLTLIPGIGQILWLYVLYKTGPCFKKPGIFMVVIPFIMIPMIAFDGSSYYGTYYTSGENRMEDEFHMKRSFLFFCFLFSALSVGTLVYTNGTELKNDNGKLDRSYIISVANAAVKGVRSKIEANRYTCDFDADVFYFHFDDVADNFFVPLSFAHTPVEGYVKVEKVKNGDAVVVGKYSYYVSVTDGKIGFSEILARDIKNDTVVEYESLARDFDDGNDCFLR